MTGQQYGAQSTPRNPRACPGMRQSPPRTCMQHVADRWHIKGHASCGQQYTAHAVLCSRARSRSPHSPALAGAMLKLGLDGLDETRGRASAADVWRFYAGRRLFQHRHHPPLQPGTCRLTSDTGCSHDTAECCTVKAPAMQKFTWLEPPLDQAFLLLRCHSKGEVGCKK